MVCEDPSSVVESPLLETSKEPEQSRPFFDAEFYVRVGEGPSHVKAF